jgi:hypothetical protein
VSSSSFPFLVSPLLRPTSPHHHAVSHFLPIESRRSRCLRFIFWQRSLRLLSRNRTIESAPPPSATLPRPPILHCYKKVISTLATLSTTQPRHHFTFSLARALSYLVLCQNQVLTVCMTQDQLFHTYGQNCSHVTKCHE